MVKRLAPWALALLLIGSLVALLLRGHSQGAHLARYLKALGKQQKVVAAVQQQTQAQLQQFEGIKSSMELLEKLAAARTSLVQQQARLVASRGRVAALQPPKPAVDLQRMVLSNYNQWKDWFSMAINLSDQARSALQDWHTGPRRGRLLRLIAAGRNITSQARDVKQLAERASATYKGIVVDYRKLMKRYHIKAAAN